uniref:AIPP2-like SPOC-like domain-containing protein n=1 Tax=Chenopodium quinoa TaxID=63459 RepID=A0A803M0U0_CHEQI
MLLTFGCKEVHMLSNDNVNSYCMRVAFNGDQEKWVCEECDSSNVANQMPSKLASSKQPSGTGLRFSIKKPPPNTRVQYIPPEEAIVLESEAMRKNLSSPSKSPFAHRSLVNKPTPSAPPRKFRIKSNPTVGLSQRREPQSDWSFPSGSKDRKSSASTVVDNSVFQKEHAWQDSSASRRSLARNTQTSNVMHKEKDESARESPTAKRVTFGKLPKPAAQRDNINLGHTSAQLGQRLSAVSSDGCAQQFGTNTPAAELLPNKKVSRTDINSVDTSQLVHTFPNVTSGMDVCIEAWNKKTDPKGRESPKVTMVFDSHLPNHPAMSPTWRGTFQITNDVGLCNIFNDIQAHPPCKVHRKVYQVSKQFPKTLALNMLPQRNYWVDIFEDNVPGELHIGLYFLPPRLSNMNGGLPASTCDLEQRYYSLLDYLDEHDYLLRTSFDEVELIIFSSKHLPEDSCKIHQKSFLWGVLRPSVAKLGASKTTIPAQNSEVTDEITELSRTKSLSARDDAVHSSYSQQVQQPMSEEHEAEDMVVDMLGGSELDNIDIVVPKPIVNSCDDHIKSELEAGSEVKALPKSTGELVIEFSPIKIEREWTDSNLKAIEDADLEFEKELQKSFDRFAALMEVKDAGSFVSKVKEEADAQELLL